MRVTRHTASASRRRACRREAPRPDRLVRDKPTNTSHGACQLGEGQPVSSLAFERRLSVSHSRLCRVCSCTTRHARCAPVRRATAIVARLTPCDSVARAIASIRARSPRSENRAAIFFSTAHRRRSRPCICDQACCPLTLSVEKPLVGKASAALPRDGRESRRRDGQPHAWSQMSVQLRRRCHGEDAQLSCASGSSGQRGTTARCLMWPGWLNDFRCWARAQRHGGVQSEHAGVLSRATKSAGPSGSCNVQVQTSL